MPASCLAALCVTLLSSCCVCACARVCARVCVCVPSPNQVGSSLRVAVLLSLPHGAQHRSPLILDAHYIGDDWENNLKLGAGMP